MKIKGLAFAMPSLMALAACAACSGGTETPSSSRPTSSTVTREQVERNIRMPERRSELSSVTRKASWYVVPTQLNEVPVVMIERTDGGGALRSMVFPKRGAGYHFLRVSLDCKNGAYAVRQSFTVQKDDWVPSATGLFRTKGQADYPRIPLAGEIRSACGDGGGFDAVTTDVKGLMRIARKEEQRRGARPPAPPTA